MTPPLEQLSVPHWRNCAGKWDNGAAAAILAEEILTANSCQMLAEALSHQPEWSDFPLIVMTVGGATQDGRWQLLAGVKAASHVILLERPVRKRTLLSSVRTALQSRNRQYQVRAELLRRRLAEAALHESDRRKDEFLAMLGHELRNPLAAISSGTTLLQSDTSPERRTWIEKMIVRQVGQLQRLVDDLLDVARITRGKIELRKAHLPLRDLLEGCVAAVEDLMNQRCHQVSMSMPAQVLYVEADRTRLEQMVVNLLTNAAKYTPQGGRIWLSAEQSDQEVIIRCRDTGVGLSPDTLGAIFEPFTQFDTSAERTSGGLGVGLALVKALAEMHGGSVTASSDGLGKGSEFVLRLPATTGAQLAVSTAMASTANEPRQPLKILVVDDNCDLADSLALFLRHAGHQVSVAHDGETAIPRALEERPEVVLLDIGLPGIGGFAVAEALRASTDLKQTMIIAVSGWKVQEKAEAARIRFDAHLVKPVDHEQLAALLQARTTHRYGN